MTLVGEGGLLRDRLFDLVDAQRPPEQAAPLAARALSLSRFMGPS